MSTISENKPNQSIILNHQFNFNKRLKWIFVLVFLMNFVLGFIDMFIYQSASKTQNTLTTDYTEKLRIFSKLELTHEKFVARVRAYILTGDQKFLTGLNELKEQFKQNKDDYKKNINGPEDEIFYSSIEKSTEVHFEAVEKIISERKRGLATTKIINYFENELNPKRQAVTSALLLASQYENQQFEMANSRAKKVARQGFTLLQLSFILSTLFGILLLWTHSKTLNEKLQIDKELIAAKEAADAANFAKSSFLANMSHEIRTPLGAVLGFAELITDPKVGPSQAENYIAAIKRNSELLSNIINDILDLSKIEANKMEILKQETSLTEILTDTKTLLDLKAKEKGISLNITINENVPEIIFTDPLRLRQILINIIGNAIKFTSKGSVDVNIKLRPTQNVNDQLEFNVKDSGPGISQDQAVKLFTPFSQADTSLKRKFGGTGLGLAISKRFAKLLGGDVVLTQSTPKEGSTFSITIDPGSIHSISTTKKITPKTRMFNGGNALLDGIKILLVEDSPDNQELISRFLKLAGATVDTASNGKEGIEMANKNHYDVLLMDLQMPVMDGYEATAKLRKSGYHGRIIALTAHTLSEERERSLKSGFDDHIGKPINRDILIERVQHWAKQKLQEQKNIEENLETVKK